MRRSNGSYFLFVATIIAIVLAASYAWMEYKDYLIQNYIKEYDLTLLNEQEIEDLKDDAYAQGFEDGKSEGFDEGYENALEDYNVSPGVQYATVYYTDNGDCYHVNPSCTSIRYNDNVHETTLDRLDLPLRPCDICVPHSDL